MANNLPKYDMLIKNYPTDSDPEKIKKAIGGAVDDPNIKNTCVVRMSKAFNYTSDAEDEIPKRNGLYSVKGADKKNYALRVEEFVDFLTAEYGAPDLTKTGAAISASAFKNKGIIAWHVDGWKDARGHFTFWDGTKGLYLAGQDFWALPTSKPVQAVPWLTKVEFWEC